MTGWRRYWLLGAIIYLPYVVSTAAGEWPTQDQIVERWRKELRNSEPEGCGGRKYSLAKSRPCPEYVNERHVRELGSVNARQDAVIGWAFVSWAVPVGLLYGAGLLLMELSIRQWHPGQLAVVYVGAAGAEYLLVAIGGDPFGQALVVGQLLFLGIPIAVLVLTWKWFDGRRA